TREVGGGGFRHDVGAMNLPVFANSPFFKRHRAELSAQGVELITADCSFGSIVSDGRFLGITTNRRANRRSIAEFSSADAQAWRVWNTDFDRCSKILARILSTPAAAAGPLEYVFSKESEVPEAVRPVLCRILIDSLRDHLTDRFESDAVQTLVGAWGLHPDYAPDIAGGCWMPLLETNVDERHGISLVKGGSGRVTAALAGMVQDAGGEVRTEQTVEKIVIERNRAVGVQL